MPHHFLVHQAGDSVGVSVTDLEPDTVVSGRYQDDHRSAEVSVLDAIPLGHKIALAELSQGDPVIEYGVMIGRATQSITPGQHVHVHNLKGERWQ